MIKKHVALVLPDLRGGGAERISMNLANALIARGHKVDMVLLSATGEFLHELNSDIRVYDLKSDRLRYALGPLVRYLRAEQPDTCLACMWPLTSLAIIAHKISRTKTRLLVAEHNTWSISQRDHRSWIRPFIPWSMNISFPHADAVIAVSKGAAVDLVNFAKLKSNRVHTIYNPVVDTQSKLTNPLSKNEVDALWRGAKFRIINVGSLKTQKNHALLLSAMALLVQRVDAHLVILGEGPLGTSLEQHAKALNISDRITFAGFRPHPERYVKSAHLFALSSDWEGLPTVIIEALAVGTPVVSTDCPSGPREILCDGQFGHLVPVGDVDALASAMQRSLTEAHDRATLIARSYDFSIDKATEQYERLLFPGIDTQ